MLAADFAPQLRQIARHISQALSSEHHVGSYNGVHLRLEEDVKGHVDSQAVTFTSLRLPCLDVISYAGCRILRRDLVRSANLVIDCC